MLGTAIFKEHLSVSATAFGFCVKDTHREKAPPFKTPALKARIYLYEVLKLKQNFQKNKVVTGKTPFSVIGLFCSYHSICLNIGYCMEMMPFQS